MPANDSFSILIERLKGFLKPLGFKKQGQTWVRQAGDRIELINVQRSSSSSADRVRVTVNLGLVLLNVPRLLGAARQPGNTVWDAHWSERIGPYTAEKKDKWWWIEDSASALTAAEEIIETLRTAALPALEATGEEELLHRYRAGRTAGLNSAFMEYARQRLAPTEDGALAKKARVVVSDPFDLVAAEDSRTFPGELRVVSAEWAVMRLDRTIEYQGETVEALVLAPRHEGTDFAYLPRGSVPVNMTRAASCSLGGFSVGRVLAGGEGSGGEATEVGFDRESLGVRAWGGGKHDDGCPERGLREVGRAVSMCFALRYSASAPGD